MINYKPYFVCINNVPMKQKVLILGAGMVIRPIVDYLLRNADGSEEKIRSSLLNFGDKKYTSIARTVALPAAVGVKMILDGKIRITGVHIPIQKRFTNQLSMNWQAWALR
jgi:saccharopine dehydrogenase-like NADP-dependent oxidoreductase